jgi:hypothetical protein
MRIIESAPQSIRTIDQLFRQLLGDGDAPLKQNANFMDAYRAWQRFKEEWRNGSGQVQRCRQDLMLVNSELQGVRV